MFGLILIFLAGCAANSQLQQENTELRAQLAAQENQVQGGGETSEEVLPAENPGAFGHTRVYADNAFNQPIKTAADFPVAQLKQPGLQRGPGEQPDKGNPPQNPTVKALQKKRTGGDGGGGYARLESEIRKVKDRVSQVEDRMDNDPSFHTQSGPPIEFKSGKADLSSNGKKTVAVLSYLANKNIISSIVVSGHSSQSKPGAKAGYTNKTLAESRGKAVGDEFKANGVDVTYTGAGATDRYGTNTNAAYTFLVNVPYENYLAALEQARQAVEKGGKK